jgi:hypothetical protein
VIAERAGPVLTTLQIPWRGAMRAEIAHLAEEIEQGLALLRRHL